MFLVATDFLPYNYLVLYVYSDFVILLRMPFFLTRWLFYVDRHYYVKAFQDFITNALLFNVAALVTRGIHGRGWRYLYRSLSVIRICCYLCLYSYTYWSVFVVFVLGSWSVLLIKLLLEKLYNNLCFFFTESIAFFVYFKSFDYLFLFKTNLILSSFEFVLI